MKHYDIVEMSRNDDILLLSLRPKSPKDRLKYEPGQYAALGFKRRDGRPSPMRCFSIVSSPYASDVLQFAIRLEGPFTHSLAELTQTDEVLIQGPFGNFVINDTYDEKVIMIAGGIGITPFMSMLRSAAIKQSSKPITLLYSYRSGHDIPFYSELQDLAERNPYFRLIIFTTNSAPPLNMPHLLSGKMTKQHLDQAVESNYVGTTYFLCGPEGFMQYAQSLLRAEKVPSDHILNESFTQSVQLTTKSGIGLHKLTYLFSGTALIVAIIGIASLDLVRYLPKHTSATNSVKTNSTAQSTTSTSDGLNSSDTSGTATTNTTPTTTSQSQTTYSAPVTSVS